jgi:two-component system chemotaxis sensor kinase CheA
MLEGEETELDRSVIEEMVDPLGHLLRNAVDHGVEAPEQRARAGKPRKGKIILAARQEENHIIIEVTDDGAGIDVQQLKDSAIRKGVLSESAAAGISDEEALQLVFSSGLSTSKSVTDVSGRGVGMDVVKTNVQRLHGRVQIQSKPGVGTTMAVRLPLTLAISQALLVRCREETIAIPLVYVVETTRVARDALGSIRRRLVTTFRGRVLPVVDLRKALDGDDAAVEVSEELTRIVVARSGEREVGMIVDHLVGEQEIVLKSLGSALGDIAGLSGATILGDGTVAMVLDVSSLMDRVGLHAALLAEDEGPPSGRRQQFDGRTESDV